MRRYIDVTDLSKQISDFKRAVNLPNSDYMTGYVCALSVTEGIIAETPTADVVEVVRCKDCKHWGGVTYGQMCRKYSGSDTKVCTEKDHYCSYGERREE